MTRNYLLNALPLLALAGAATPARADHIIIAGSGDFIDEPSTLAAPSLLALIGFSVATDEYGFPVGTVDFQVSYDACFATSPGKFILTSYDANHDFVDRIALDPYPVTSNAFDDRIYPLTDGAGVLIADTWGASVHGVAPGGEKYLIQLGLQDTINHSAIGPDVSMIEYLNDLSRWPYKQVGIGVDTSETSGEQLLSALAFDVRSMVAIAVPATCPIPDPDTDGDGLPDSADRCAGSSGGPVNADGCTVAQLVPCAGPKNGGTWKNHGKYVSELVRIAQAFVDAGLISEDEKDALVNTAASTSCGK